MKDFEREPLTPPTHADINRSEEYTDLPNYLDCGSIQCYIPEGVECYFEVDQNNESHLIHCVIPTSSGECILSAYASPTGKNSWPVLLADYAAQLRSEGVQVQLVNGLWGQELQAEYGDYDLHIIGFQGDRWILRAVVYILHKVENDTNSISLNWLNLAYRLMSNTRVNRGTVPLPMFSALPLSLPDKVLGQIQEHLDKIEKKQNPPFPELVMSYLLLQNQNPTISDGFKQIIQDYSLKFSKVL